MIAPIRSSIDPTNSSRLLMTISPDVGVSIILLPARDANLLLFRHRRSSPNTTTTTALLLNQRFSQITINLRDYTPTTELRRARGSTQGFAVATFPAQDGGFILFPVALAPVKASILGPEKEPDRRKNKRGTEQGEEREDAPVVDISRVKGPLAWFAHADGRGGIAGVKEGTERCGIPGGEQAVVKERRIRSLAPEKRRINIR